MAKHGRIRYRSQRDKHITRIPCADKPIVRTVDGIIYLSASDADMAEGKAVAIFARLHVEERDLVDVFLFQGKLTSDSPRRVGKKLAELSLAREHVSEALKKMVADRKYHVRNIEGILEGQLDAPAVANLRKAGGAAMIFDQVMELLQDRLKLR